jgi:hypothetical protein
LVAFGAPVGDDVPDAEQARRIVGASLIVELLDEIRALNRG